MALFKLMNTDDVLFHHMSHTMHYLDRLGYYLQDIVDFDYKMKAHRNHQMRILSIETDFYDVRVKMIQE